MVFTEKTVPLSVIVWPVDSRCISLCDPLWPAAPLGGRHLFEGEGSLKMSLPCVVSCLAVGGPLLNGFPVAVIPRFFNHLSLLPSPIGLNMSYSELLEP